MSFKAGQTEYKERKEKIIKARRWFSPSAITGTGTSCSSEIRGRILKMQHLSKGRGTQFLVFTYNQNVSLFLSASRGCYNDFISLVRKGDVIVVKTENDNKGISVVDFSIAAVCVINLEDLNFFNHNSDNYMGDALHKGVCGSRSEIDNYKAMSVALHSLHHTMQTEGFLQILTPAIERQYRGGYARPYISRSNYLREDIYLRVTAEIYHKQLIVGGLERLYEIILSFRNESASQISRNGFNLVEVEAAYANEDLMLSLLHSLIALSCNKLGIDVPMYSAKQSVSHLLYDTTGKSIENITDLKTVTPYSSLGEDAFSLGDYRLANLIFRRFIVPLCQGLCIIQDLRQNYSPFVMKDDDQVYRWFVVWNGHKIAEVYRSETDASTIMRGLEEVCRNTGRSLNIYDNYIHSQFSGMPPIATMSIGIERIIMILCNKNDLHRVFE